MVCQLTSDQKLEDNRHKKVLFQQRPSEKLLVGVISQVQPQQSDSLQQKIVRKDDECDFPS